MKIALAMIVKGVDNEAPMLMRCLHYASEAVDNIFITVTHAKGEKPSQKVYDICNKFQATTSKFEWTNDFAEARNFNFQQVPKDYDYIFWLDADDVLKDKDSKVGLGSLLKPTIASRPDVDAFTMFYLYAFDEHNNATVVHQKTRVVKNDGTWHWEGLGLHESLVPNRQITTFGIKGIEVVHLSNDDRLIDSRQRNYAISKTWVEKKPEDPTSYYNVGNSAFGLGRYEEALGAFDKFLELSKSDEEKYIVRLRRGDVLWAQKKNQEALDEARYAIGMKPEYPDAYHAAGRYYYALNRFEDAKNMFLNGLVRKPPYYQIIVYNPRDYDYKPLMDLAKTYYALNLPQLALPALEAAVKIVPADESLKKTIRTLRKLSKEGDEVVKLAGKLRKIKDKRKLRRELEKIKAPYKYHPMILMVKNENFIKDTSSGKDLVIFCGFTEQEWTPATIAKTGSGGSEEAITILAEQLSDNYNVTVYNNCGTDESVHGRVTYKPYMSWNYRDKQDITILWRNTKPLDWDINSTKVYVDMHDVIPAGEFTSRRIDKLDKVFFKSNYHRGLYPLIPIHKTVVIPNGIWPDVFKPTEKDRYLMVNTSSPVRALTALIEIMKQVRKQVPEAKMQWAYGWEVTDGGMANEEGYPAWKEKTLAGMKEAGIEDLGRLTHKKVAALYDKASFYIYPTGFPEIDCISITKAQAANCMPISTKYAAIADKTKYGGFFCDWTQSHDEFKTWDMSIDNKTYIKWFVDTIVRNLGKLSWQSDGKVKKDFAWPHIIEEWNRNL